MINVIYLPPDDKCVDIEYLKRDDISSGILLKKVFDKEYNRTPKMHSIEIETINACNNDCSFCPASRKNDTRVHQFMSEELFKKIILELETMQYNGMLSLFSNNEPLLDKRIFSFIAYAKKHLPNAKHALYTNGILLNIKNFKFLCEHLDKLIIDNYNDAMELNSNIRVILDDYNELSTKCEVSVFVRKKNQIRDTRGGQAPNREYIYGFDSACMLPITQMVIRPDGKVSMCCQDAMGVVTLGDVSKEPLRDVWTGEEYTKLRKKLLNGMRGELSNCKNCDIFGVINYRPREWDLLIKESFLDWIKSKKCECIYVYGGLDFYNKIVELIYSLNIEIKPFEGTEVILKEKEILCIEENDSSIILPFEAKEQGVGEKILICGVLKTVEG